MAEVRIATFEDREGMIKLLHQMHKENGVAPLSEPKMLAALDKGLRRDHAIIGVIGDPGDIKASIGLFAWSWWYSNDWHLEDFYNFVRADSRKSTYARDLLDFAKRAADEIGVQLLIGVLSTTRTKAKIKLYERSFGPQKGAAFVYGGPKIETIQ